MPSVNAWTASTHGRPSGAMGGFLIVSVGFFDSSSNMGAW